MECAVLQADGTQPMVDDRTPVDRVAHAMAHLLKLHAMYRIDLDKATSELTAEILLLMQRANAHRP